MTIRGSVSRHMIVRAISGQRYGFNVPQVEAAVSSEVRSTLSLGSKGTTPGGFSGRITLNQLPVEYRALPQADGSINVGTIFKVN
jgi:hypothetical protein